MNMQNSYSSIGFDPTRRTREKFSRLLNEHQVNTLLKVLFIKAVIPSKYVMNLMPTRVNLFWDVWRILVG